MSERIIEVVRHKPGAGYWREVSVCRTDLDARKDGPFIIDDVAFTYRQLLLGQEICRINSQDCLREHGKGRFPTLIRKGLRKA